MVLNGTSNLTLNTLGILEAVNYVRHIMAGRTSSLRSQGYRPLVSEDDRDQSYLHDDRASPITLKEITTHTHTSVCQINPSNLGVISFC